MRAVALLATSCAVGVDDTDGVADERAPEGPIDASAGDLNWNGHDLGDTRPHQLPDGSLGLWSHTGSALVWYDLSDALAGMWTVALTVPTGVSGQVVAEDLMDVSDLEGDGELDFVVGRLSDSDGESGLARFAGSPTALIAAEAALYVESVRGIGLGGDLDGDGVGDAVVAWHDEGTAAPSVAWVSPVATGSAAISDVALGSLLVDPNLAPGTELACRASRAEPFDAGCGLDRG